MFFYFCSSKCPEHVAFLFSVCWLSLTAWRGKMLHSKPHSIWFMSWRWVSHLVQATLSRQVLLSDPRNVLTWLKFDTEAQNNNVCINTRHTADAWTKISVTSHWLSFSLSLIFFFKWMVNTGCWKSFDWQSEITESKKWQRGAQI